MTPSRRAFLKAHNDAGRHFTNAMAAELLADNEALAAEVKRLQAELDARTVPRRAALEVWRGLNAAQTKE